MATYQLIPPGDDAPPGIGHLSPADRVGLWAQMIEEDDQLVFDGFRRRHQGDHHRAGTSAAEWLDRRAADSFAAKLRILVHGSSLERSHGG